MTVGEAPTAIDIAKGALLDAARSARRAHGRLRRAEGDPRVLHDFRVRLRRLRTLLAVVAPLFRGKTLRRAARTLRTIASATGAMRDEEVLGETLGELALRAASQARLTSWLAVRAEAARVARAEEIERLDGESLRSALDAIVAAVERPARERSSMTRFADEALARARCGVAELLPWARVDEVAALHRLRIRMKRLRYLAEWLADVDALDASARARCRALGEMAAHYQGEFGLVHDLDIARATVAASLDLDGRVRGAVDRALAKARREVAVRALTRLRSELPELVLPPSDDATQPPARSNSIAIP